MILSPILQFLLTIVPLLLAVAFFTVVERQVFSAVQRRQGPNVVGFSGLLQAIADALKLLMKETIIPSSSNAGLFFLSPLITFSLALVAWSVLPLSISPVADPSQSYLFILALSSFAVYGVLLAGWSSNSKYAFLGGLRSTSQMVSYEVSIGFLLVSVLICAGTMNFSLLVSQQEEVSYLVLWPVMVLFFISLLAETNRHPFDLPEAEAELVSGYNVEYSAAGFVLFFIGEYSNMILMSAIMVLTFWGGTYLPRKILLFILLFILARAAYPRFRYDQLIRLGWKVYLPLSLSFLLSVATILLSIKGLPILL